MSDDSRVERFVAGFIGVPGRRTFLIEIAVDTEPSWYLLEKAQVAAFVNEARRLLTTIGYLGSGAYIDLGGLTDPDEIIFRIGEMRLAYDDDSGIVTVTLISTEEQDVPVEVALTPAQLDAAVRDGADAVEAGRPLCPRCGLAMDPEGHPCPTTNGDLRHHRP